MTTYPTERPPLPKQLTGQATVKGSESGQFFTVNFDTGECDCTHGAAWNYNGKKYEPKHFCNHKLRATASLVKRHGDDKALRDFYEQQVGKRYNPFVITSAFHKELRRGNVTDALYWATCLIPHRGPAGVVNYMRNIVFEETRDLDLFRFILKISSKSRGVTLLEMQQGVRRFCVAPKKWELPWRFDIFLDEQRGYKKLANDHTYAVAKPKDIIPALFTPELRSKLFTGYAKGDRVMVQEGLKGLLKSQHTDHEKLKIEIFNDLTDVLNGIGNKFTYDEDYAHDLHSLIYKRMRAHGGLGYHECNALADALCGEPGRDTLQTVTKTLHKRCTAFPKLYKMPLAEIRKVPLYAQDNHTHEGKRRMAKFATQLRAGADQTDLDFRLCGAYMGVAWRLLAEKQFSTIECKWGEVSWAQPSWLWSHLDNMWY